MQSEETTPGGRKSGRPSAVRSDGDGKQAACYGSATAGARGPRHPGEVPGIPRVERKVVRRGAFSITKADRSHAGHDRRPEDDSAGCAKSLDHWSISSGGLPDVLGCSLAAQPKWKQGQPLDRNVFLDRDRNSVQRT